VLGGSLIYETAFVVVSTVVVGGFVVENSVDA